MRIEAHVQRELVTHQEIWVNAKYDDLQVSHWRNPPRSGNPCRLHQKNMFQSVESRVTIVSTRVYAGRHKIYI